MQTTENKMSETSRLTFTQWPLDLLIDYVLKVHHRTIRREGPGILKLISQIMDKNENLIIVHELFAASLEALDNHLMKEENVLFPYLYELFDAHESNRKISPMHCGTISNPIHVMMMEHGDEMERYNQIAKLTDNYAMLAGASDDYHQLMVQLKGFHDALLEHIQIEDNIIFQRFQLIEMDTV